MFTKLTYQKKLKFLPWVIAFILLLVYWFAVSETLKLRRETLQLEKEAAAIEKAPMEMAMLKKKTEDINKITGDKSGKEGIDPLMELISGIITNYQVTLADYQPVHLFQYQNYSVETRAITIEAPFISCLRVLHDLENRYHYGKVVSVSYMAKTDNKTFKRHLKMQILLQSIHNEKENIQKGDQE